MLDKQAFPRSKPCGGGLSAKALDALPYDVSEVVRRWIDGACIRVDGRADVAIGGQTFGAMVERAEFDAYMLQRASDAGAHAVTGRVIALAERRGLVRVETSAGSFTAPRVIGADGASSTARRLLFPGWRARHAFAVEAKICLPGIANVEAMRSCSQASLDFATVRDGYAWAFPKRDHFNVGIYRLRKRSLDSGMHCQLERFIGELGGSRADVMGSAVGHPIPLSDGTQPLGRGGVVLIGDAAGLGEAFFGEGIAFALQSGLISAQWAIDTLDEGASDPAPAYAAAMRPMVARLNQSRVAAGALYAIPQRWLGHLAGQPALVRLAVSFLCNPDRSPENSSEGTWREVARRATASRPAL